MKQIILSAAIFLMSLPSNTSSAQGNTDVSLVLPGLATINALAASHTAAKETDVNIRAIRDFSRTYKNAPDAKWFKSDKGFFVSFDEHGANTKIVYDSKGRRSYAIISYAASKLDRKVRSQVMSTYFESTIIGVHQFEFDNATVYVLKMMNQDSSPLTLKVTDDKIEDITSHDKK
jgi:hypothetical protein